MKIKLSNGKDVEELFGFGKKKSAGLIKYVSSIINDDVDFIDGIKMIYEKAKNSRELGYMIIYYVSINHVLEFDEFIEKISEGMKQESELNNMYR